MADALHLFQRWIKWLVHTNRRGLKRIIKIEAADLYMRTEAGYFFTNLFLKPRDYGNGSNHYRHAYNNTGKCNPDYGAGRITALSFSAKDAFCYKPFVVHNNLRIKI